MATLDEKVKRAERELEDKRSRQLRELDKDKETEVARIRSLRNLIDMADEALPQFTIDPAIRDMLTGLRSEAELLLKRKFDNLGIPT